MSETKNNAAEPRTMPPHGAGDRSDASRPQATPDTDLQGEDAGTPDTTAANRGSPAAPVMKQFQKTRAEGTGRP